MHFFVHFLSFDAVIVSTVRLVLLSAPAVCQACVKQLSALAASCGFLHIRILALATWRCTVECHCCSLMQFFNHVLTCHSDRLNSELGKRTIKN